jgi:hypothetical protein
MPSRIKRCHDSLEELTDGKKLPKDERKRKQVESAAHKSSKGWSSS